MPSPKPRPAGLKLLEGVRPGRDSGGRLVKEAPSFVRLPPTAPDWLPTDARAMWEHVVPGLQRLQLLKPEDLGTLTAYCLAWDRMVSAQRIVAEEGMVVHDDKQGRAQRHPALLTVEAASKELRALAGLFGLSPSDEAKVGGSRGGDDGADENPFAWTG